MKNDIAVVSYARSPLGKAKKGALADVRPDDLAASTLRALLDRSAGLVPEEVDDLVVGCAMPEGDQGLNVARTIGFLSGLPDSVPAMTLNRFCASGLESLAGAAAKIGMGWSELVIAGGVESMSTVPMGGFKLSPSPALMRDRPEALTGMGITAELVAERFEVSREAQDAFAARSQQRAEAAQNSGRFDDEIAPYTKADGTVVRKDDGVRPGTTADGLAKLRPVFKQGGTVTAGNASQTTDGAAFVLLASAGKAERMGVRPVAYFRGYQVVGVDPDIMGVGPRYAIPALLDKHGLGIGDIDLFEINEAFASQAVYCARELGIDGDKLNVNGGAIALGHPLGCTGARLTATLLAEMKKRGGRYGVVSMCIGGGMGAAALFEMA